MAVTQDINHTDMVITINHQQTNCFRNLTAQQISDIEKSRKSLNEVLDIYFGWLVLPIVLPALFFTTVYALAVYKAIKTKRVYRKCFVLLLNRTIGDLLCCISTLVNAIYVLTFEETNIDVLAVIQTLFASCFWSAMVSYISLSFLKLYAVWSPMHYRHVVNMKRCIYLIVISWVIFIIIVLITLTPTALTVIPVLSRWSGCKLETCSRIMYRIRNLFAAIVYLCTIIIVAITVVVIKRAQKFSDSFRKKLNNGRRLSEARIPLWKLTVNIMTFAMFNSFYAIFSLYMLAQDKCYFQMHFVTMMRVLAFVRIGILMRISIDVLISFAIDHQIRHVFYDQLGLERTERSESTSSQGAGTVQRTRSENSPPTKPDVPRGGQGRRASCIAGLSPTSASCIHL